MPSQPMPPAMILCGGQGTRLRDVTESLPKPMVPVGTHPIVWHVMKIHAAFGVRRFILCLGYKREVFIDYFLNYRARATDITVQLGESGTVIHHGGHDEADWEVTLADTGETAMTGARVARAARHLRPEDKHFFLSYGDGLANVNLSQLHDAHVKRDSCLTVTGVRPGSRFGELALDDDQVTSFREKPQGGGHWVNGGFMLAKRCFAERYLETDDSCVLEQEPMRRAVEDGQLAAHRHEGFWQCMDTAREYELLNSIWRGGNAPWTEHWSGPKTDDRR